MLSIIIICILFVIPTAITGQFTSVCDNRVISNGSVTGGICYEESLATDMRDWNSAFNSCSSTNRSLARVLNEEMSFEIERITQDTDEYWIGLSRPDSNSEFMWSDDTSVSDTRWSSGHPIDGLNCVSVRGNSIEWYSSNCSDVKRYVCETNVCVDWTVRNGICYQRFDTEIDADAAISFCQSQNAYLAEIPNIYVDNVITEIIGNLGGGGANEHWIGLRTNDTHYYWRLGNFSLGNDTPSDSDNNECGAVDENNGNRWIIRGCNRNRRTMCMIGPLTNEIPIEKCENLSADTLVYEDSCYTRIIVNRRNLDRATLTCTDYYNGTLYDLRNATVNQEIRGKFGSGNDISIVDPNEYSGFTAQDGYFNLFTSDNNYTDNPNCVTIDSEGVISDSGSCPEDYRCYICKRASMSTSTATSMTANMSTSTATSMTASMSTSTATSMTASMSTSTATSMTASMSTSTTTSMTASMSTSTTTSMTENVIVMIERIVELFLEQNANLPVGGNATEFNQEINADIIAIHVDSNIFTNITFESVTVGISPDSFQANAIIVSAVYRNTSDFTSSDMILSDVITIVSSEELSGNLTIRFTIIQINKIGFSCYSLQNGTWVTDGIETTMVENTVICETSHLTTFAVLIDPSLATAEGDHSQYQAYISVILCGLSLVALLTTIILYLCLGKKFFRKDINIIQLNFVIALIFALITFFLLTIPYFGMTTLPPQACGAIALLTQYCWLSVFSWNFCQALHIILALFGNKLPFERHYIPLILIGWGIPIPIVLATLAVGLVQGEYQHAESCFLSTTNGLIWAFLGPIFFIILVNTCILIFIIIVSIYVQRKRRHKLAYSCRIFSLLQRISTKDVLEKSRRLVIGIATTIPLLGLPWVVGLLLRVIPNTDITFIVANYIFIIVNASQGLIFFVAHVIRNQEIRTLCSSSLKADIDIHPDDKEKKKEVI